MKIFNNPDELLTDICEMLNTPKALIKGKSREKQLVYVRHIYFYIATHYYKFALKHIGQVTHRDHTSIIHGRDAVKTQLEINNLQVIESVSSIKEAFDIQDNLHLDYQNLLNFNKDLLSRLKELRKENVMLLHENLKLKHMQ
jgi:hypothetical protein